MIAVLFARKDSIYKTFPECDVYDVDRDALTWKGGNSVIAHPPCRLWSRLSHFSTAPESEKYLAIWSIDQVRKYGGVLEHPAYSKLWNFLSLPNCYEKDKFEGWTLPVRQFWFGHRAEKKTWLYIVGCLPGEIPEIPFLLGKADFVCSTSKAINPRPEISHKEREQTPIEFAKWLICLAKKCNKK